MPSPELQEICCLLGKPVSGNPTQYMMERAFAHHGLDWRYLSLEVAPEQLPDAVRGMRAMGFRGGNVTLPHKTSVVPLLDSVADSAALMGAVNCIVRQGDSLVGENTDGKGFVQSLRPLRDPVGLTVVILGAGGAARAIAVELALSPVAGLTIVNRSVERGQELASLVQAKTGVACQFVPWQGDYEPPPETHVLINSTSIGLGAIDERVPVRLESLNRDAIVADVIPNPPRTRLLREAADRGFTVLDGLGMLVNQAVIGFRLWTGIDPNPTVLREALEEYLEV
jgi:shikimate dehydrogenase